jgi:hypothetical protein
MKILNVIKLESGVITEVSSFKSAQSAQNFFEGVIRPYVEKEGEDEETTDNIIEEAWDNGYYEYGKTEWDIKESNLL